MTTTATLTLTDFLLARIEDDEAAARAINKPPMWQSRISRLDGDLYQFVSRQHPARVLAECEAKRRIVEALVDMEPVESERHDQVVTLRWVCKALAVVFSDHPDYDDSWRP